MKLIKCNRCFMDSTAVPFVLIEEGCNYCEDFLGLEFKNVERKSELDDFVKTIKSAGSNKQYDCIVGVSGGVDSSYVLVKAVQLGLRPLVVHMDNCWNSELAQNNINHLVEKLDVELYTHVIDWAEYKLLMQAFFDADVIDVEMLYDNAMLSINFNLARKYGIKYILSGENISTEGVRMPQNWNWWKMDDKNIRDIASKKGVRKFVSFPLYTFWQSLMDRFIYRIKWTSILDLIHYDKEEVLLFLEKNYSYKRYPYKHYESIFTRFYQGFILPKKFNVDKRKMHISTLYLSGQVSRSEAHELLKSDRYPSETDFKADYAFFLKKMNWTESDLNIYLARPEISHNKYKSYLPLKIFLVGLYRKFIR